MTDEEFEEEDDAELGDDLDEEELEEEDDALNDDLDPDLADDADLPAVVEVVDGEIPAEPAVPVAAAVVVAGEGEEDEDVIDLDEELHPDDVEAPLDALLQERTASATLEDEEEEVEEEEVDVEPGEAPAKIVPRRPGEFLCSSCFLVLPRNQLADEERMLCRDCA
ncbi:MAG TPA: DUF4193 family protein [Acidimicrobiia bacterium]|nr:DUF4193 family protein [Acidimicrobiia bacterium]